MEKQKFKIKNKILIEPDMFYSEAFDGLSASALRTLLRSLQKRKFGKEKVHGKKRTVYYNDGFIFPYCEAAFLKIGTTQHWKNIKKLIEVGFWDLIYQGGWYQKNEKEKDYSVYKLSERWEKYGTPDFQEVIKPKVLQTDFYVRNNIRKKKIKTTSLKRSGHLHESEVERAKHSNDCLHDSEVEGRPQKGRKSLATIV